MIRFLKKHSAIYIAKLAALSTTKLHLGSGSQLPGRIALKIEPKILDYFYQETLAKRSDDVRVAITGTNGKTTTTGFLRSIINRPMVCNEKGANLYAGVTSAFINHTNNFNKLKSLDYLLEVDEASLPKVASSVKPTIIAVTNLYRDQLDRFGELDRTKELINNGIDNTDNATLILNAGDHYVSTLGGPNNKKIFYKVIDLKADTENLESSMVVEENNTVEASIIGEITEKEFEHSIMQLKTPAGDIEIKVNLPGAYNVYDAVAAAATAFEMGYGLGDIKFGIENYKTNFGRAQEKIFKGVKTHTFLIKNPAGATQVIKHLSQDHKAKFLIIINDNYADGRDVSWLWDAEFEHFKNHRHTITVSGVRAKDMAVRLKYAGVDADQIETVSGVEEALEHASHLCSHKNIKKSIKATLSDDDKDIEKYKLYILPTYTALLNLEKIY